MKTTNRIFTRRVESAMTLAELLVVIAVVGVLVFLIGSGGPTTGMQKRAAQTRALAEARQVALALKLYADDNSGNYPSFALEKRKADDDPSGKCE